MRKLTSIILLLISFLGIAQQKEKQSYSFSLQQAIAHGLEHNYTVINSTRDIDIAEKKKWETTAAGLPQINGAVDYTYNIEIPLNPIPAQFIDPTAPEGEFTALPFQPKQSVNARATLSQLIFDGSYIVALQASKTYLQYYRNAKLKTDNDVREMIITAYGNVLLAEESIAILERNRTILDKTLSDTRETFKNGLIEEENVEQLEITQSTLMSNLNNAKRLRIIAGNLLKVTLGIDLNDDLVLTDKLETLAQDNMASVFTDDSFNVENTIDYQIGVNFTQQRNLEWKLEKSKALPTLAANVNFGYNAFNSEFRFLNGDQKYYNYSSVGVSLNVPIFSSGMRSARSQQAKIRYEQAKTQLTETEQRLKLAHDQAKSEFEFAIEEFTTRKNSLRLAERIESKQSTKFTEGLSSSFDFSEAQRQLYDAQQSFLQSMSDVITRKAALEKITNSK
ncbi:MAG: TolC family protein [Flavobacterium sp.]|nr:MAG: TolC family protein [Flavobacterium sp.]